jgi:peptidoglycan/LPS O-acetylase OafA/YrhL
MASLPPAIASRHPAAGAAAAYFPWFDWLRIVLALVVALGHDLVLVWEHSGDLAVQVFFALSGWLIGGILLDTDRAGMARFYFNRATRIWIPYALALLFLVGVSLLRDPVTGKWCEFVFYKLTFVYNVFGPPQLANAAAMPLHGTGNHFWSICAEEQFYLLAPLLLVVAGARFGRSTLLWVALAALALSFDIYGPISLGVLAALLHRRFGDWHLRRPAVVVLAAAALAAVVGLAFPDRVPYRFPAATLAISVVLLLAREGTKSRVGGFLGGVSYPLYLNHWLGIFLAHALMARFGMRDSATAKVAAVVLNLALCSLLYVLVDRQIQRRRAGWFTPRLGWRLAIAGFISVGIGLAGGLWLTAS